MKKLIALNVAMVMLLSEVDEPNGFWSYLGIGIIILTLIKVFKDEQENI